jgi:hypothetical protein
MLFTAVKINFVEFVNGLAEGGSAFHIVVCSIKNIADDNAQAVIGCNWSNSFKCRKQFVVDETE